MLINIVDKVLEFGLVSYLMARIVPFNQSCEYLAIFGYLPTYFRSYLTLFAGLYPFET